MSKKDSMIKRLIPFQKKLSKKALRKFVLILLELAILKKLTYSLSHYLIPHVTRYKTAAKISNTVTIIQKNKLILAFLSSCFELISKLSNL